MSIEPPFPPMQLKHLTLFLIHGSQPIMKKGRNFSQWGNPYTPYCFSCVESLLSYKGRSEVSKQHRKDTKI